MKKAVIGILAHVDAGKTTLSEAMLYGSGNLRSAGRVDHGDAFLDTYAMEKERGITIFSKQAILSMPELEVTLVDTPGHVDFSAEMERTLQVLDYAILVISGTDGVQGHTETLWNLLKQYKIPTFIFVNKMDMNGTESGKILDELKLKLNENCIMFSNEIDENFYENIAMCDENILDYYMSSGEIMTEQIAGLIKNRKIFPCYFGSALKMTGISEFLKGLQMYICENEYGNEFAAKVYKVSRDEQGMRLTYLKVTGGNLKTKMIFNNAQTNEPEKVNQIRLYSGAKFKTVDMVEAGSVCAVTGLNNTYPGQCFGVETEKFSPILQPVLTYQIIIPEGSDVHKAYLQLKVLEEEEPQLHIVWNEHLQEIHAQLMGEVQIEIVKNLIKEKFQMDVEFGEGNILYKETISDTVEGVGHFEPLRHYAEVHLKLEPAKRGSGLHFYTDCSEDMLDRNWQRLILTHLAEKEHIGVLTGSPVTDMNITLIAGKAHLKHTEGGDFRQSTYRAVRQGLKMATSVLLEPYYSFKLVVPSENVGRAMTDIQRMSGTFETPNTFEDKTVIAGKAPVALMRGYVSEVNAYTKGRGSIQCTLAGYDICHNSEEIIEMMSYDSEKDLENPTGSVFCSHGAGFVVSWDKVREYMHIETNLMKTEEVKEKSIPQSSGKANKVSEWQNDKELKAIFERTFGPIKTRLDSNTMMFGNEKVKKEKEYVFKEKEKVPEYLLVDGYNIIFSWDTLNDVSKANLEAARGMLMDILCNYQGYKNNTVIVVFDAYKVKGNPGEVMQYNNISVVYTKEAETADMYIEKAVHKIGRKYNVTVATSDGLEQLIIMGQGAKRISAREFKEEIENVNNQIRENYLK